MNVLCCLGDFSLEFLGNNDDKGEGREREQEEGGGRDNGIKKLAMLLTWIST